MLTGWVVGRASPIATTAAGSGGQVGCPHPLGAHAVPSMSKTMLSVPLAGIDAARDVVEHQRVPHFATRSCGPRTSVAADADARR